MKKDRFYRNLGFIFLILGLIFIVGLILLSIQSTNLQASYQDFFYKEYTFLGYERKMINPLSKKKTVDYIMVKEEERPLTIPSNLRDKFRQEDFLELAKGDSIYCYLESHLASDAAYEIVELKTKDTTIISLSDYNLTKVENSYIGLGLLCISIMSTLGVAIYFFLQNRMQK